MFVHAISVQCTKDFAKDTAAPILPRSFTPSWRHRADQLIGIPLPVPPGFPEELCPASRELTFYPEYPLVMHGLLKVKKVQWDIPCQSHVKEKHDLKIILSKSLILRHEKPLACCHSLAKILILVPNLVLDVFSPGK